MFKKLKKYDNVNKSIGKMYKAGFLLLVVGLAFTPLSLGAAYALGILGLILSVYAKIRGEKAIQQKREEEQSEQGDAKPIYNGEKLYGKVTAFIFFNLSLIGFLCAVIGPIVFLIQKRGSGAITGLLVIGIPALLLALLIGVRVYGKCVKVGEKGIFRTFLIDSLKSYITVTSFLMSLILGPLAFFGSSGGSDSTGSESRSAGIAERGFDSRYTDGERIWLLSFSEGDRAYLVDELTAFTTIEVRRGTNFKYDGIVYDMSNKPYYPR